MLHHTTSTTSLPGHSLSLSYLSPNLDIFSSVWLSHTCQCPTHLPQHPPPSPNGCLPRIPAPLSLMTLYVCGTGSARVHRAVRSAKCPVSSPQLMVSEEIQKTPCSASTVEPYHWPEIPLFFWPHHAACSILVPQPGIEPGPQQWKRRVLTTGPPGNSRKCLYLWWPSLPLMCSGQLKECPHLPSVPLSSCLTEKVEKIQ